MSDNKDEITPDPVLVRPYITTEPGSASWPRTSMLPAENPTAEMKPVVERAPDVPSRRATLMRQRLLVLSGVVVLALGAVGIFLLTSDGDAPTRSALPTTDFSYVPTSAAGTPGAAASRATASASARASRSATAPASGTATASVTAPEGFAVPPAGQAAPASRPTSAAPAPSATLAPPPGTAITGPVTSSAGRCLALGGLLGVDGTPIQAQSCTGVSYQSFTLATDGTLRVAGHCTQATDDGTVRSVGCDDRDSAQWRRGPGGTLVNRAAGLCLTDPGSSGASVRVDACTGAENQSWSY